MQKGLPTSRIHTASNQSTVALVESVNKVTPPLSLSFSLSLSLSLSLCVSAVHYQQAVLHAVFYSVFLFKKTKIFVNENISFSSMKTKTKT